MEEIWKDITGYEGIYQVSNMGRIKTIEHVSVGKHKRKVSERIRVPRHSSNGYLLVNLHKGRERKYHTVHRLVALAFCNGYFDGADVNHIDGNKRNNVYTNLEWCTRSENMVHSFEVLGHKKGNGLKGKFHYKAQPVVQLSLSGDFIKEWGSSGEIRREIGYSDSCIRKCLHGKQESFKGYKWVYAKDYYK